MKGKLKTIVGKKGGRDSQGRVTVRQRGGESKRYLRRIDFRRDKKGVIGVVAAIEYDPNRNVSIALVNYPDGDKRYVLLPEGLKVGEKIISDDNAEVKVGNHLPLRNVPIGTPIHNLELSPNKGGQIVRGAGLLAVILAKEGENAQVKLPSGEMRLISLSCWGTIGQIANAEFKFKKLKKAGDSRRRGIRPTVRGVAQDPHSHPHGGGEGRSGIGMPGPKTRWGKPGRGKKTRRKLKYSNKFIIKRRK